MSEHGYIVGLQKGVYLSDARHALLASDTWRPEGPNIGLHGHNLTITFLSLNRASLSERLLLSITKHLPDFAGEVLIIDNGSASHELATLRDVCAQQPYRFRIVELGKNYGVSGGRNRTIPHVRTEWLMCLDNDIYFTRNPLPQFQKDLAQLGCHFMSLPLLDSDEQRIFARGGHLYVSLEEGELHIGAGSACRQEVPECQDGDAFVSTFLFGGACIIKRQTFEQVGAYDEAMFIGFEDIDFSIRLFQQGYKVGSSGTLALVHDHPQPSSEVDRDYEKERFSRNLLRESALHMERKHGFRIWSDAVDSWLASRHRELSLNADEVFVDPVVHIAKHPGKPRIALIIDTHGWAFSNIARQLERNLSDRYDFTIIPMDVVDNINQVLLSVADCDLVHFFWREHLRLIGTPYYRGQAELISTSYGDFERRYVFSKKITTSIYDHLLLDKTSLEERKVLYESLLAGYSVGSNKLQEIYLSTPGYPAPSAVLEDGVDLTLFKPDALERFDCLHDRELVVGWVGNSQWASEIEDFKGLHTILKPAIERLRAEGLPIRAHFADRQEQFIPHQAMPAYYASIDVYVCASKIEGTPNPVLESMACGVPIISTDVGIVPQAFGPLQAEFILAERTVDAVADALRRLLREPALLKELSKENMRMIAEWDWTIKAEKFAVFFDTCLYDGNRGECQPSPLVNHG
ncbi:glycosyltransferase [Janthinobacterium sp. GB4P2]|uniref:glycosyltransferase n=1 Tax=Janthinobacterium sp. GB4P2 TaxID=3424189 RepID=UPI003F1EF681